MGVYRVRAVGQGEGNAEGNTENVRNEAIFLEAPGKKTPIHQPPTLHLPTMKIYKIEKEVSSFYLNV